LHRKRQGRDDCSFHVCRCEKGAPLIIRTFALEKQGCIRFVFDNGILVVEIAAVDVADKTSKTLLSFLGTIFEGVPD